MTDVLKGFHVGIDCYDLYTILDGLLLVIGNGLGVVPSYILTMGAKLTLESGEPSFDNEVKDILK